MALAAPPGVAKNETVTVRADEAWEDPKTEAVHFRGNFEIRASDWSVTANEAALYGPLDDPDRVVAVGRARIRLNSGEQQTRKPVNGEADRIEYQRASDRVTLIGNARLHKRDNTMQAARIEYDRANDSFRAGGKGGGVQIMFTPPEKAEEKSEQKPQ
jgi:lipopolysaccharide transport protein LptA